MAKKQHSSKSNTRPTRRRKDEGSSSSVAPNPTASVAANLLEHPEMRPFFESIMDILVRESDKGAVLIAAAVLDSYLGKLFERVASGFMSAKELKRLLAYPGALATLAGKADIALATRLIGPRTHKSISLLRRIRNDVAHSLTTFSLTDHRQRLHDMYDFGPGVAAFINDTANATILESFVRNILEAESKREPEERHFQNREDVLSHLRKPVDGVPAEAMQTLQEKALRMELGLAVGMLCATIVTRSEQLSKELPSTEMVLAVTSRDTKSSSGENG